MDPIAHIDELRAFCDRVREDGPLALDMEFERERSYRPILQLVQVASRSESHLIDPLALEDLSPLWELVADPAMVVIVHAGMQDMEIFHHAARTVPTGIFDTQVAAALLGMGEQVGYGDLVRRILGVRLQKGERTTDWSRRPLSDAQKDYALDDVRYLHGLYDDLDAQLGQRERRSWLEEELAFYGEMETYEKDPRMLWLRVSRHRSLDGKALAVLRELAIWREETAARRNIPRNRVVQDDVLVDIARRNPKRPEDLKALRRLNAKEAERSAKAILGAVERGRATPRSDWPVLPAIREDDPQMNVTVDLMGVLVRQRARDHRIAATYLATKRDLSRLLGVVRDGSRGGDSRLLQGWRHELVGRDLVAMLHGQLGLSVDPVSGHVRVEPPTPPPTDG